MSPSPFDPDSEGKRLPVNLHPPRDDDEWSPPVPREHGYRDPDYDDDECAAANGRSPVEPYHGKAQHSDPDRQLGAMPDPFASSTRRPVKELIDLMHKLPFSGLVRLEPPRYGGDMIEFMADTASWFTQYGTVIAAQSDNYTRLAARVGRLEDEREAVRGFFGLKDDQ